MIDFKALARVDVEFADNLSPERCVVLGVARATVRKTGGGVARGPKGAMIAADMIAYLLPDAKTHGAPFVRIEGKHYAVAFVDTDFGERRPVRVGLSEIEES